MDLDHDACYAAVSSRDARFDGRFCTAVRTTMIYCRPSCPARTPHATNVDFYADPAAAEVAGFRACKRCRPDRAPDSPDVDVRGDLTGRALRLIGEGLIDREGVPGLAQRLAISERQLRRVLVAEVGAGPLELARNRRTRLATALLEGSELPVGDVAFAAGFGSIRQLNDTVLTATGRTPTQIRGLSPDRSPGLTVRLPLRLPFDAEALLAWLAGRTVAGLDSVEGTRWRRVDALGTVTTDVRPTSVTVHVETPDPRHFAPLVRRVRRALDLDADPVAVTEALGSDPRLRELVRRRPGLRLPAWWTPWEGLVRTVIGQQVSVRGARTQTARLVARHGAFPTPEQLVEDPVTGMPRSRAATIRELAVRAADGRLVLDGTATADEVCAELGTIPGIGPWTLAYSRLRALRDPDALPATDLILRRAAAERGIDLGDGAPGWRPWRSYASHLLWTEFS